ncbi:uncharacterized protein LOC135245060 isoform X2 [Anguilla rostrata]|uniref:uncharacterized protein LOC135245060 isoform X2 n=1 Tax=Anguilla rostrata TaxID=7938 RepID=UPI0030CA98EB
MDNCDLEKLSISVGKLYPPFEPNLLNYKVIVPCNTSSVTLELLTSDCGASYKIHFGDGSNVIQLNDGINTINIEVVAEDGTAKTYCVEVTKLSASVAELCGLEIDGGVQIQPEFSPNVYEYSSAVHLVKNSVTILPKLPDVNMQVSVNGSDSTEVISLNIGDTLVNIEVCSADGTKSQVYTLLITREQIPLAVTFKDERDQMEYECPFSLTALYRPVSVSPSDPKHIYSAPCIDVLTRRSKVDPLDEHPLGENWKSPELDLDRKMSAAPVKCFFAYRGCESVMKLSEVGSHAKDCPHKPPIKLDAKDVTETEWYKKHFASSSCLEIQTKHSLETRSWEKQLWKAIGEADVHQLCSHAKKQLKLYRETLPKPGDSMQYEHGRSPLDRLDQAAVHYASAVKLKPRDPQLHFLLGQVLEEQHYAAEMYGLKKTNEEDSQEPGMAEAAGREEEILAICRLHGFSSRPTLENQLKALDAELHQLKEQGLSGKADYIQTLFIWLSKRAGKDGRVCVSDEESWLHRALLKYLDAWSLRPESWEYGLHVGRLLLEQGRHREALPHLQVALALQPCQPALRFYSSLALLQQEGVSTSEEQKAVLFLHQGLEHTLALCCSQDGPHRGDVWKVTDPLSAINVQFLRGCLVLGELLQRTRPAQCHMTASQVYHTVVVLALRGVCRCVCRGQVAQQLEWVQLDAHFALLQSLTLQPPTAGKQLWVARRCQALSALIRLTTIAPCQELLNMQEKVCQIGVVTTPGSSQALCLLGIAQLAQHDDSPASERGQTALADARLSFRASVALEGTPVYGAAPEQLTAQKWWQDWMSRERKTEMKDEKQQSEGSMSAGPTGEAGPAGRGGARGRGAPVRGGATAAAKISAPGRGCKHLPTAKPIPQAARGRAAFTRTIKTEVAAKAQVKVNSRTQASLMKTTADCCPTPEKAAAEAIPAEEQVFDSSCDLPTTLNCWSHTSRLGLARAYSRSPETREQACELFREVITKAPKVHDAYIELAELLVKTDPMAAVEVYCRFPLNPVHQQTFDDAFIVGEIVHILMKQELYDHPQLGPNLIAYGKLMGLGCLEKYIEVLDGKFKTNLLKTVYAGIHDKSMEDEDLQEFFKFKCWI